MYSTLSSRMNEVEVFPNQYKLLEPLSLSVTHLLYAAQSSLYMALTKAACTLVDLGLGAFVAKVFDLTHSFQRTATNTQTLTFSVGCKHLEVARMRWNILYFY